MKAQQDFINEETEITSESIKCALRANQNEKMNEVDSKLEDGKQRLSVELDALAREVLDGLARMQGWFDELLADRLMISESEIKNEIESIQDNSARLMADMQNWESYYNLLKQFETEFDLLVKSIQFTACDDDAIRSGDVQIGLVTRKPCFKKMAAPNTQANRRLTLSYAHAFKGICKIKNNRFVICASFVLLIVDADYTILDTISYLNGKKIGWIDQICSNEHDIVFAVQDKTLCVLNDDLNQINVVQLDHNGHRIAWANQSLFVLYWNFKQSFIDTFTASGCHVNRIRFSQAHLRCLNKSRNQSLIDYSFCVNRTAMVFMIYKPDCCYSKFFIYDTEGRFKNRVSLLSRNLFHLTDRQLVTFNGANRDSVDFYYFNNWQVEYSYSLDNDGAPKYERDSITDITIAGNKLVMCEFRGKLILYSF